MKTRNLAAMLLIAFMFLSTLSHAASQDVENFVKRLYNDILNREADPSGLNYWKEELLDGKSATYVAKKFFFSQEFKSQNLSDKEYLQRCYRTFFDREPDQAGEAYWLSQMSQGVSRSQVFYGFAFSQEFEEVCKRYGMTPYTSDDKLQAFIDRLYNYIMDREPGEKEIEYWRNAIKDKKVDLKYMVKYFFFSPEFTNKNVSDEEFVKKAFKTILDRDPDKEGFNYWVNKLTNGESRESVVDKFLSSEEFFVLANSYVPANDYSPAPTPVEGDYRLLAWNDLGMHCMDKDYSVFSILPPFNTLNAQLIKKGEEPELTNKNVRITYESLPSLDGKWNTTSYTKTNFWDYVAKLFNVSLNPDVGLKGKPVQSKKPADMEYDPTHDWWIAEGIPTVPRNDDGSYNYYPMVKVVARDLKGNVLAETVTVLPVSDEMNCKQCHGSASNYDEAKPIKGWSNESDPDKDYKYNILRLHDQKHNITPYLDQLKAKGYEYKNSLEETARSGTPVLCAVCHKSNALGTSGFENIPPLTAAIHSEHAKVKDPKTGKTLNDITNRNSCYACHPGKDTQCLRGAMGGAKDANGNNEMQCQSCHGTMSAVGDKNREGWLDEPTCQNCHQEGKRYKEAVTDMMKGTLRAFLDHRFATNPDTPIKGKSLYRFSKGHGDLQCSACHGSTHAIYESSKKEDNLQSIQAQGHAGTIAECTACHTTVPMTKDEGPHGMHTVGQSWVKAHEDIAEDEGTESCKACHGQDYKGSFLSKTFSQRTFNVEGKTKTFQKGHQVSCYDCHNGPSGEEYEGDEEKEKEDDD